MSDKAREERLRELREEHLSYFDPQSERGSNMTQKSDNDIDLSSVSLLRLKLEVERREKGLRESFIQAERALEALDFHLLPKYISENMGKLEESEYMKYIPSLIGKIVDHWDDPTYWYGSDLC